MNLRILALTAVSLGLAIQVFADNYSDLAEQGYRWVAVNGPYACSNEKEVRRILDHHTDATELQVMQSVECYYLIPGTIVQVIKEDPVSGWSEIQVGDTPGYLWTYTVFLSKHPVRDTFGAIEMPPDRGLRPKAQQQAVQPSSEDNVVRTQSNENP
jgi:hypothetical protein